VEPAGNGFPAIDKGFPGVLPRQRAIVRLKGFAVKLIAS
jgi:hypothetical protein